MFSLGQLCYTPGVRNEVSNDAILRSLKQHHRGDWGTVCASDKKANDAAVKCGDRIFSVYVENGTKFWIITEADRSSTCILLPEEY